MSTFTATADTELREDAATTNYGSSTPMTVLNSAFGGNRNVLMKFGGLPTGGVISATLRLYVTSVAAGVEFSIKRLRRSDWVEGEATWNVYKTGSSWSTGGGTNTTNDVYSTTLLAAGYIGTTGWNEFTLDMTEARAMFAENNGMNLIGNGSETYTGPAYFSSREGANPPELILTVAGSQVIMVMAERWKGFLHDLRLGLVPPNTLRRTYKDMVTI